MSGLTGIGVFCLLSTHTKLTCQNQNSDHQFIEASVTSSCEVSLDGLLSLKETSSRLSIAASRSDEPDAEGMNPLFTL